MLLGEDVLSDILLTGGPKGAATLTESVFGGAIRGHLSQTRLDLLEQQQLLILLVSLWCSLIKTPQTH